jgi:hypothetical protein
VGDKPSHWARFIAHAVGVRLTLFRETCARSRVRRLCRGAFYGLSDERNIDTSDCAADAFASGRRMTRMDCEKVCH